MTSRLRPFVLLIAIAVCAIVAYDVRIRHEMVDFLTWRRAVVRGLDAEPLYRPDDGHYQFKFLPMFALLMAPFGRLDPETAKAVWFGIEVVLLISLVRWSVNALPERRLSERTLVWCALILMAKFYAHELLLGQINLLLAVLILAGLVAVRSAWPMTAGSLIGLAVFVKPYALILFPWLFVTQRWPAAATAAGVVAIGLLLPSVVYGWSGNLDLLGDWWRTVGDSTAPNLLNNDNVSIASMWAKWVGPGALATGCAALTIVGTLALAIAAWRRRAAVAAPEYLEIALLMLLIPLLSPQGWDYVLLLATPAVVCLVDRWREFTRLWQWGLGVALALMSLTMFDIMGRALYGRFMALSVISVCALALAAGLVRARWDRLA